MPGFRLNAKNLFLTYPQCDLPLETIRDTLLESLTTFDPSYLVVSSESHEDGQLHRHVFIALAKKSDIRNANALDINGFHGNYQTARNPSNSRNYVIKDGHFIEWGVWAGGKRKRDEIFSEALAQPTREEAEEILRTNAPRDYAMGFGNISKCLDKVYTKSPAPFQSRFELTDFDLPATFTDWFTSDFLVSYLPSVSPMGVWPRLAIASSRFQLFLPGSEARYPRTSFNPGFI